jgi:hypothetical protein
VSRPFYIVHGVIHLPILVVALGQARLVRVARLLLLLLFSSIEGHLLSQSVFVGDSQHHFRCPGIPHGELAGQGRVPESLLKEHDYRLVVDLQNNVSIVAKTLDKLLEGLSFLLDYAGMVLVDS